MKKMLKIFKKTPNLNPKHLNQDMVNHPLPQDPKVPRHMPKENSAHKLIPHLIIERIKYPSVKNP